MILDRYMDRPILWDGIIATGLAAAAGYLIWTDRLSAPDIDSAGGLVSDMSNAGFTASGFILTVLTILVTFKGLSPVTPKVESASVFELFFHTDLYHRSVTIIKNCVYAVLFISGAGYFVRLILPIQVLPAVLAFVFGTTVILLSLWRCTLVLSKILRLQREG
jgi:hypothetical protein